MIVIIPTSIWYRSIRLILYQTTPCQTNSTNSELKFTQTSCTKKIERTPEKAWDLTKFMKRSQARVSEELQGYQPLGWRMIVMDDKHSFDSIPNQTTLRTISGQYHVAHTSGMSEDTFLTDCCSYQIMVGNGESPYTFWTTARFL